MANFLLNYFFNLIEVNIKFENLIEVRYLDHLEKTVARQRDAELRAVESGDTISQLPPWML